ncbi:TLD domain-containing protein 1 [Elysia marginata]|uniref:MTOR-associated protein MEAK7 n=1 Tax=Elysia marginata TaxID=1093978 RepID=A0AAV4EZV8_9GAST|nr:TLD domain-containing protein 1 [Elysia marginata]
MGGSDSKSQEGKEEYYFNEEERDRVQLIFCNLSHSQKSFSKENLQHFTEPVLDHFTSSRLFDWLERPLPGHKIHHDRRHHTDLQHFAAHLAILLKGHVSELSSVCLFLASTSPASVSASDLVHFVGNSLHSYEKLLSAHCTAYQSWIFTSAQTPRDNKHGLLASSLLSCLLKSAGDLTVGPSETAEKSSTLCLSVDQVEDWLSRCHLFHHIFQQVLKGAFQFFSTEPHQIVFEPRLPQVRDTNWSKFGTMLDFSSVLFLNAALPSEQQTQWRLVYSNVLHGHSFARFLQCITSADMPTVLVIRDKSGRMFGGFASIPWQTGPKFTGDHSCFLFEVGENFNVYKPTGYNQNFMYLNTQQQTLPNGLGMGGQFDYFGLWIDQSFDRGHSKAGARGCTTYGSPQLSAHPDFDIDFVEVWAVGRRKNDDGEEEDDEYDEEAKVCEEERVECLVVLD